MSENGIETRLVYGFLGAGKTSYVQDCIRNDPFYKRGSTLVLCFEEGEEAYDPEALAARNAAVAYHDGKEDVRRFCARCVESFRPDRIYVEMNAMMQGLRDRFPPSMRLAGAVTWLDWTTFPLYYLNFKPMIKEMVADSQQVTFRGCPAKALLAPYSQAFRVMNRKASYLRQDPMGYHERAFDLFLPFSPEEAEISVTEDRFVPFWLDAHDHPEHYEGKLLHFTAPLELRRSEAVGPWSAGRVVMVCCMADLQFMAFPLKGDVPVGGWAVFDARGRVETDEYGQKRLTLKPAGLRTAPPPAAPILDANRPAGPEGP